MIGARIVHKRGGITPRHGVIRRKADLIAFGRPFIANPDLVERLKSSAPLPAHPATLYGGGAEGYTDYPTISG